VRSVTTKMVEKSQGDFIKNLYGMVFFAGQLTLSATTTLYGAVHIGCREWLSILTDYASAPTTGPRSNDFRNVHKAILADELCQDPVIQKHLSSPRLEGITNKSTDVSIMDWVQNPEKVITDELFRAVKACRDRKQR
jgi:hypothetical protein